MKRSAASVLLCLLLAGCGSSALKDVGRAPAMSPIGSGLKYGQTPQMALYPKPPRKPGTGYSLWTDAQSDLFKDARAMSVGDILTVNIAINDKATFDNKTDRDRTNSSGINASGEYGVNSRSGEASAGLKFGSNTSTKGKGTTARSENLELRVAAVVTGVLDNGNLVISGSQEVRVNFEMRILNIAGIVRPRDVDAYNTIAYEKIAEARVSYGGRGRLMEVQQPPVGQQLVDKFSPI
ncbi:flagellar basal body L-ring protein FlgH [Hoeflea sp. TYP-13]|uniref:flagellar basal body L-ring protein FlgH n=1 Tax=Hoeflea sp. TYP-13 TaxID=3230023 RepID=UPI0034C5B2D5